MLPTPSLVADVTPTSFLFDFGISDEMTRNIAIGNRTIVK
jgi:hypothetical protein